MNSTQYGSIALILALVLIPQVLALYFSSPNRADRSEPEECFDGR